MAGVDGTSGSPPSAERLYVGQSREEVIQNAIADGHTFLSRYPDEIDLYIQHDPATGQYYIPNTTVFQNQFKGFGRADAAFQTHDVYDKPEKAPAVTEFVGTGLASHTTNASNNVIQSLAEIDNLKTEAAAFADDSDAFFGIMGLATALGSLPISLVIAVAGNSPFVDVAHYLAAEAKTGFAGFKTLSRFNQTRIIKTVMQWIGNVEKYMLETYAQVKVKKDREFKKTHGISNELLNCMSAGGELTQIPVDKLFKAFGFGVKLLGGLVALGTALFALSQFGDKEEDSDSSAADASLPSTAAGSVSGGEALDLGSLLESAGSDGSVSSDTTKDPTLFWFENLAKQYTDQALTEFKSKITGDQARELRQVLKALQQYEYEDAQRKYDVYVQAACDQTGVSREECIDPQIEASLSEIFETLGVMKWFKEHHGTFIVMAGAAVTVSMLTLGGLIQGDTTVNTGESVYERLLRSPKMIARQEAFSDKVDARAIAIANAAKLKYASEGQCQESPAPASAPTGVRVPSGVQTPVPGRSEEGVAPAGAPAPSAARVRANPTTHTPFASGSGACPRKVAVNGFTLQPDAIYLVEGPSGQQVQITGRQLETLFRMNSIEQSSLTGSRLGAGSSSRVTTGGGPTLSAGQLVGGILIYTAGGVLLGAWMRDNDVPEDVQVKMQLTYAGGGFLLNAAALKANPALLAYVAPAYGGFKAGQWGMGRFLDVTNLRSGMTPPVQTVVEDVGGLAAEAGALYAAYKLFAISPASKTPVGIVAVMAGVTFDTLITQAELERWRDSFLAQNPNPIVHAEFSHVCDVMDGIFSPRNLSYFGKGLDAFTDEDVLTLRWLLGDDVYEGRPPPDPLSGEILRAMGPWFLRQYVQYEDAYVRDFFHLAAKDHMTGEELQADEEHRARMALGMADIVRRFENADYSPARYGELTAKLSASLTSFDPRNLQQVHNLLYDPRYENELKMRGEDILNEYLQPFMEAQFGFRNTALDQAEEWLTDWVRDDSEVAALAEHRKTYGNWMLALARHVQEPGYNPKYIVSLPKVTAPTLRESPTLVNVATVVPSSMSRSQQTSPDRMTTVSPRAPTSAELQKAKEVYAELKKKPSRQSGGLFDVGYAWNVYTRGDVKPKTWYDESLPVLMGTKMQELHDAEQIMAAGEVMKLWIQDVKENLGDEWGLSDADAGEALQMLTALEHDVEEYQRSGDKSYLFSAASHRGVTIGPGHFMGNFLTDKMREIVRFVDEA